MESHPLIQGYISKFITEKLPVFGAIREVLPIWQHLLRRPSIFFTELAKAPRLSWKNATVFCWLSATLITAFIISLDKITEIVAEEVFDISDYKPLTLTQECIIETVAFVYIMLVGVLSSIITYLCGLILLRKFSIKKLIISSLYMGTFVNTIGLCLMTSGVVLELFQPYKINMFSIGSARIPFGNPEPQGTMALSIWSGVVLLWSYILAPSMCLSATSYVTGVSPGRLYLSGICFMFCLSGVVILILFLAYLAFS